MQSRTIAIPRLLHVESGCLGAIEPLLRTHGFDATLVCVVSGVGPSIGFAERVERGLSDAGIEVRHERGVTGRIDQAAELAATVIEHGVTLVLGVGGGRVIDSAKLAAARTGVEFVSVPTTIAHDGISSPVASLAKRDGIRSSYAAAMPGGVVVDIDVIASAPPRTLRAGAGDLASNLTAELDWQLADRLGHDRYDAFSAMIAESAARPVLDLVDLVSDDSHRVLAKGLLMSGLAMAAAGTSRPCSGAEHLISHSLDGILGADAAMHGEQVALGSLISAAAHGSPLLTTLKSLYAELDLPVVPEAVGIPREAMLQAVRSAPATRPDRYTILTDLPSEPGAAEALLERAFDAA